MRTSVFTAIVAISTMIFASSASAQQKIAVIDLEKLIRLHPNTTADKQLLEETLKDYTAQKENLEALAISTRRAFEEAAREASNPALSESARKKAEEAAIEKRKAALEADRNATEKIRELQKSLTDQEILMLKRTTEVIERAVRAYAKGNGIDLVLQLPSKKLGAVTGVLYAKNDLDITEEIMKLMGIKEEPEATEEAAPAAEEK